MTDRLEWSNQSAEFQPPPTGVGIFRNSGDNGFPKFEVLGFRNCLEGSFIKIQTGGLKEWLRW
jgi:hypothetical protein